MEDFRCFGGISKEQLSSKTFPTGGWPSQLASDLSMNQRIIGWCTLESIMVQLYMAGGGLQGKNGSLNISMTKAKANTYC